MTTPEPLVLSVDTVVLSAPAGELRVLLCKREKAPFRGRMALPGVALTAGETLVMAARRALVEKAGASEALVDELHVEQLAAFDALFRDPRGRTVSAVHLALARAPFDVARGAAWTEVRRLERGSLPFDHDAILAAAVERLRSRMKYSDVASHLVGDPFPLEELHTCYEGVLGRELDRSNFRAKLLKIGLIKKTGVEREVGERGGRPRHLYRFERDGRAQRDFI